MAARGAESKKKIIEKLLEVFPDSFTYDGGKEIRIPIKEGSEIIQIKCVLTAAKTNVENGADTAQPSGVNSEVPFSTGVVTQREITAEEKTEVHNLIQRLNL